MFRNVVLKYDLKYGCSLLSLELHKCRNVLVKYIKQDSL